MKPISMLPNLLTLSNAACGLLAVSKGVDALAWSAERPELFYSKMESACLLVFLAMVFDGLDGWVARLTASHSDFGAELDSLSDAVTFGVAPALLAKVLIEHEGPLVGWMASPRLHFAAAACFTLMAILRLARFNLETDNERESHEHFHGLPSPAAAGAVVSTIWVYLILMRPELEVDDGTPTPLGWMMGWFGRIEWGAALVWVPAYLTLLLPLLGLLMVSRLRYVHVVALLTRDRRQFFNLVLVVFGAMGLFLAPVPFLFVLFNGFVAVGLVQALLAVRAARRAARGAAGEGARP